jgi:hypothetical protein
MSRTALIAIVCIALIYSVAVVAWAFHRAKRNYPKWIVPQLQKKGSVRVGVRNAGGTWNPAKPTVAGRVFASGRATYTLDEGGIVHLQVQPKKGPEHDFSGPLPDVHELESPRTERLRRLGRLVSVAFVATLGVGFAIGYFVAGGAAGSRLAWGLLGLGVAWLIVWLGMLIVRVEHSISSLRRDSQ